MFILSESGISCFETAENLTRKFAYHWEELSEYYPGSPLHNRKERSVKNMTCEGRIEDLNGQER